MTDTATGRYELRLRQRSRYGGGLLAPLVFLRELPLMLSSTFRSPTAAPTWSGAPVKDVGPVHMTTSVCVEVKDLVSGESWRVTPRPGDGTGEQLLKEMTTDLAAMSQDAFAARWRR